jgi:hypothetical protein
VLVLRLPHAGNAVRRTGHRLCANAPEGGRENLKAILPRGVKIARLHWGGGTPTLLQPDHDAHACRTITEAMPLAEGAEFSVEIDPNEIDEPASPRWPRSA